MFNRFFVGRFEIWKSLAPSSLRREIERGKTSADCSRYAISASYGSIGHRKNEYDNPFYWDGPFGFILRLDTRAIACISFKFGISYAEIVQIQGVRGERKEIRKIDAENLLVRTVILIGTRTKLGEIRLVSGRNCPWRIHVPLKMLLTRYDERAIAHGFRWDRIKRVFVLKTTPQTK